MRGFSLVELSIVLVILGLLTGGILAGQNLIRAAELRSVSTEFQNYVTATQTFRDKYFAIPGDFRDATRFWGRQVSATHCATNSAAAVNAAGACDGAGDGILGGAAGASQASEHVQYWRHLAKAGLLEGDYSGLTGSAGASDMDIGINVPRSKFNEGGWTAEFANFTGNPLVYDAEYGNHLKIGKESSSGGGTGSPLLTPEEAWNIDTKMDDGRPAYGKVLGAYWNNLCAAPDSGAASSANRNASYRLQDTSQQCVLFFIKVF